MPGAEESVWRKVLKGGFVARLARESVPGRKGRRYIWIWVVGIFSFCAAILSRWNVGSE